MELDFFSLEFNEVSSRVLRCLSVWWAFILFLYLLGIPLSLHLVYIAVFGVAFLYFAFVEFSLLWSFLAVGGVVQVACQGFMVREACVGVLVGGAGFLLSGVQ